MKLFREPLVGGESARLIAAIIRAAPVSVVAGDRVIVHLPSTSADSSFARAYQWAERAVMIEEATCSHSGSHQTLDPREFQGMVVSELMRFCRRALGEQARAEALWMASSHVRLFATEAR